MKFVIFLAVAVAAAASLPLDEKPLDLPFSSFFNDDEIAKQEVANEYANDGDEFELINIDQQDVGELRVKIRGNIKIKVKLSNPVEIEQSLAENEESIWVRTGGSNKAGNVSADGDIRLSKKQLNERVVEELALLGINARNAMDRMQIAEPTEIEEIELLPENPEDDPVGSPRVDVARLRIRIRIRIRIKIIIIIRKSRALATKKVRMSDEDKSIWIRVKDNHSGVNFVYRGVADVEELGDLEIAEIDAPPGSESA